MDESTIRNRLVWELVVGGRVEDSVQPSRQAVREVLHLEQVLKDVSRRQRLRHALAEDVRRVPPEALRRRIGLVAREIFFIGIVLGLSFPAV